MLWCFGTGLRGTILIFGLVSRKRDSRTDLALENEARNNASCHIQNAQMIEENSQTIQLQARNTRVSSRPGVFCHGARVVKQRTTLGRLGHARVPLDRLPSRPNPQSSSVHHNFPSFPRRNVREFRMKVVPGGLECLYVGMGITGSEFPSSASSKARA